LTAVREPSKITVVARLFLDLDLGRKGPIRRMPMAKDHGWSRIDFSRLEGELGKFDDLSEVCEELGISSDLLKRWHEAGPMPMSMERGEPGDGKPGPKGYRVPGFAKELVKLTLEYARRVYWSERGDPPAMPEEAPDGRLRPRIAAAPVARPSRAGHAEIVPNGRGSRDSPGINPGCGMAGSGPLCLCDVLRFIMGLRGIDPREER
jgi:hypothetical protein